MLLLRKVNQNNWFLENWSSSIASDDVPGDALSDLRTASNKLSFWRVTEDRSNLRDVAAAIVLSNVRFAEVDYVLTSEAELAATGIEFHEEAAPTPLVHARAWHVDASGLTGRALVRLANALGRQRLAIGRVTKSQVTTQIAAALRADKVDVSVASPQMQEQLRKLVATSSAAGLTSDPLDPPAPQGPESARK